MPITHVTRAVMVSPPELSSAMMEATAIHVMGATESPALPLPSKGAAMDTCVAPRSVMMEIPLRGTDAAAHVYLSVETAASTPVSNAMMATQTQEMGVTLRANPSHAVMAPWK